MTGFRRKRHKKMAEREGFEPSIPVFTSMTV